MYCAKNTLNGNAQASANQGTPTCFGNVDSVAASGRSTLAHGICKLTDKVSKMSVLARAYPAMGRGVHRQFRSEGGRQAAGLAGVSSRSSSASACWS